MPTATPAPPGLHTAIDVACALGQSERTVHRKAADGRYPSHRVGNRLVFTDEDLLDILAGESEAARG